MDDLEQFGKTTTGYPDEYKYLIILETVKDTVVLGRNILCELRKVITTISSRAALIVWYKIVSLNELRNN